MNCLSSNYVDIFIQWHEFGVIMTRNRARCAIMLMWHQPCPLLWPRDLFEPGRWKMQTTVWPSEMTFMSHEGPLIFYSMQCQFQYSIHSLVILSASNEALISLRKCAGWSGPLLPEYAGRALFSCKDPYIIIGYSRVMHLQTGRQFVCTVSVSGRGDLVMNYN